jgi:hypothetical protein
MNPHIRQLIDRATEIRETAQPNSMYPDRVQQQQIFDKELFAELIANECKEIISRVDSTDQAVDLITQYFDREYNGKTNRSKSP